MAITLTQLRSFLAVMRTGSITAAADELIVTQPSVSAAVAALSRELGVELTERAGRSVRPTAAGTAFEPYAADVIGLLDRGRRAAIEAAGSAGNELRIAAVTTAAEYLVPAMLRGFHALFPELTLTLEVGNRETVFEHLLQRRADIGVAGRPPADGRLRGHAFLPNEIVLITAPDDPLADADDVEPEDLTARPWLLREEGSGTRAMCELVIADHELDPRRLTLGSNGAIKQAAAAGLGIALQSRVAVELELQWGVIRTIPAPLRLGERHWYVLHPASGPFPEAARAFLDFASGPRAQALLTAARQPAPAAGSAS